LGALKIDRPKLLLLLLVLAVLAGSEPSVGAASVAPPIRGLAHYVYVDLSQQRLYEVHRGVVTHVLHVSSGGGYRYTSSDGVTRIAATPVGRFRIYRKLPGWHRSYLGSMYYPSYFDGGYAIHGDPYVPAYPVSHGCIRIPMGAAIGFYARNAIGTPVFVVR
jgi:lipoprotein-anchoring transpeptidase ErfK/SrfK